MRILSIISASLVLLGGLGLLGWVAYSHFVAKAPQTGGVNPLHMALLGAAATVYGTWRLIYALSAPRKT